MDSALDSGLSGPGSSPGWVIALCSWARHLGLVHTMPDKFEKATLGAKTEQKFFVHTTAFYQQHNCLISL